RHGDRLPGVAAHLRAGPRCVARRGRCRRDPQRSEGHRGVPGQAEGTAGMKQAAAVPMLEVEGLDACYGTSQALFGMSLTVHAGETLALLGRNGAGKSTTMKAVAGIVPARAGSIRLRGTEIRGRPPHAIARAGIGFVPEDRQIFADLSVVDNLLIAAKAGVDGERNWRLER